MLFVPLALLTFAPGAPPESPSLADRAATVVAQKARMPNRYTLKLRVEGRVPNAPPQTESAWSSTLHVWRDGKKFRVDHFDALYTPPRPKEDPRDRHISCENCEREGYGLVTKVLPGSPPALHVVEFHRIGTWNFDGYCAGFDWRYFGLSNASTCMYQRAHVAADFPKFFGLPEVVITAGNRGGLPCLVASRKVPLNNTAWSVWLSEHDEFNPVFFEEKFDVEEVPESRTTEISWQRTAGGHFFPKRVKHNSMITRGGTKCASEEVVTVTHADFDSPIDPAVFTVAGLGLNENQAIGFPNLESKDLPLWRNGRIDYEYTVEKRMVELAGGKPAVLAAQAAPAAYPSQVSVTLVVGIVAAVLAVGTGVAAVVVRRRRGAS